ncbi:hypothetical protein PoB_002649800 [Plakobranchus ocellatus]|uniref:Uncharacterized protein n=1 Tax=Plakobranchus ocellatus TaxID=259542 RepID=A0AAV3ZYM6_9GAST|nr:hypothetical protein PoB_002649800 [Plakobranchus ocellatus]
MNSFNFDLARKHQHVSILTAAVNSYDLAPSIVEALAFVILYRAMEQKLVTHKVKAPPPLKPRPRIGIQPMTEPSSLGRR